MSLALANFLCGKQGRKVAYIELNTTHQIESLSPGTGTKPFSHKGIRVYPHTTITSLPELLGQDFDVFLLDMGVLNTYTAKEFIRCDRQFLLCSLNSWKQEHTCQKLEALLKNIPFTHKTIIIGNCEKKESTLLLSDGTRLKVIPAPFLPNPFQLHSELFPFFGKILGKEN
jgi:hypothetical protein